MFPGFVTLFKDSNSKVHLYFFPGLDENNNPIYKDLDMTKSNLSYTEIDNNDKSKEFIFDREDIIKMKCKLIKQDGSIDYEELTL